MKIRNPFKRKDRRLYVLPDANRYEIKQFKEMLEKTKECMVINKDIKVYILDKKGRVIKQLK